jgi:repressor LexA
MEGRCCSCAAATAVVPGLLSKETIVPDFSQLTERQREIYDFIRDKIESRGFGPTVREIGEGFDIKSPNGVMCHLKALEKKALIKRTGFRARAIQLIDHRPPGSTTLPLFGLVAAGSPTEAIAQDERLDFKDLFGSPDYYALKVRGQSMIEDHIDDGDYVVIDKKGAARATNGDRVVARIRDEVTLKRYYRERHRVRLEPANKTMSAINVNANEDVEILGTLVGVVRRC